MKPLKYLVVLSIIIILDTLSTLFLLKAGIAEEANPLFSSIISYKGIYGFVFLKSFISVLGVFVLGVVHGRNLISEKKAAYYYAATIIAYLVIYVFGLGCVHIL